MRVLTRMWQMLLKSMEEVAAAPNAMMASAITAGVKAALRSSDGSAGGAAFLGSGVVALMLALGTGNVGVVWAFVALYAAAFVMVSFLNVPQDDPQLRETAATTVRETS